MVPTECNSGSRFLVSSSLKTENEQSMFFAQVKFLRSWKYFLLHILPFFDYLSFIRITMSPLSQAETTKPSTSFIIPDLVSHCDFPLSYNVHGDEVAKESVAWLDANCPDLNAKQRRALYGLQAGELTAYTYTSAPAHRLRVVSDFLTYLFHLYDSSFFLFFSEAFWHVANRFFSIAETILAMAWWLGRPTFLQMSSWTHFGSPTSTRPLIVLGRCSRKLSLTPENSHESKSCFLDRPALLANLHAYTFSPFFLASGDVASQTVDLAQMPDF